MRLRDDSSECVEEKLKKRKKKKKMRKNYTERADLLAYREVRIYIKEKREEKLVNDKTMRKEREKFRRKRRKNY